MKHTEIAVITPTARVQNSDQNEANDLAGFMVAGWLAVGLLIEPGWNNQSISWTQMQQPAAVDGAGPPIPCPPSRRRQSIAFVSDRDGNDEIYLMDADGSNPDVSRTTGQRWQPSWSPDGKQIVFTSDRKWRLEPFVWMQDGTRLRQLTDYPAGVRAGLAASANQHPVANRSWGSRLPSRRKMVLKLQNPVRCWRDSRHPGAPGYSRADQTPGSNSQQHSPRKGLQP